MKRRRHTPEQIIRKLREADRMLAEGIADVAKALGVSEQTFHRWRNPVFHRKDERIRAQVLICFLALVLVRLAETRSGQSWRTLRAELGQVRQGHFRSQDGEFTQTSELTTRQRQLHAALGVPEPSRFGRITPRRGGPDGVGTHGARPRLPRIPLLMRDRGLPAQLRSAELGLFTNGVGTRAA